MALIPHQPNGITPSPNAIRWWAIDRPLVSYAAALVVALFCVVVRAALEPLLPADAPLLLFPAVVVAEPTGRAILACDTPCPHRLCRTASERGATARRGPA